MHVWLADLHRFPSRMAKVTTDQEAETLHEREHWSKLLVSPTSYGSLDWLKRCSHLLLAVENPYVPICV